MQAMFESLERMRHFLHRFAADQSGATSIEYAVMSGGIALAITASYGALTEAVAAKYDAIRMAVVK